MNSFLKWLQDKPLEYFDTYGDLQTLKISEEVMSVLSSNEYKLEEFEALVELVKRVYRQRQETIVRNDDEETTMMYGYYTWVVKKLLLLNSLYNETRHIKQLLYGTEFYHYLNDDNVVEMIDSYIGWTLLRRSHSEQERKRFVNNLKADLYERPETFVHKPIKITEHTHITPDILFDDQDFDTKKLLEYMAELETERESWILVPDKKRLLMLEFHIRCLTETPYFTYNLNKAIGHKSHGQPLFYIDEDRNAMTKQWKID